MHPSKTLMRLPKMLRLTRTSRASNRTGTDVRKAEAQCRQRRCVARNLIPVCLCITLLGVIAAQARAQQVSNKAPSASAPKSAAGTDSLRLDAAHDPSPAEQHGTPSPNVSAPPEPRPSAPPRADTLPNDPAFPTDRKDPGDPTDPASYPIAVPIPARGDASNTLVTTEDKLTRDGANLVLDGHVTLAYAAYRIEADHIDYDENTQVVEATGHLRLHGNKADELLTASHGTLNLQNETGRFYDVTGSVGLRSGSSGRIYTSGNPFLFSGRMIVRNGPADFEIFDGTVTSCQLPRPDWRLSSAHFVVHDGKASARGTVFRLRNLPILYLPFVTHPVPEPGAEQRQSGILIPVIGQSSTKGLVLGEQIYFALSRSTDLTIGSEYFSKRGWQQSATFRYKGTGLDFLNAHFSNLLDRGFQGTILSPGPNNTIVSSVGYVNQGGEDLIVSGRKDFSLYTRVAADAEYLSKYAYRQAFTDNFNQAVATDIVSILYGTHQQNGYVTSVAAERYQGLKRTLTGEQVRILHTPTLDFDSLERHLGPTPFLWSASFQSSAIKRTQGTDSNASQLDTGIVERIEIRPEISLPMGYAGFRLLPSVAVRESFYTQSRAATPLPGPTPVQSSGGLNRALLEAGVELRTPVLERTFDAGPLTHLLGRDIKHTLEPEAHYRYVTGVSDFDRTLRFDVRDVVSDTNELEYGLTQRLFLRPSSLRPCEEGELPNDTEALPDAPQDKNHDITEDKTPRGPGVSPTGPGLPRGGITARAHDEAYGTEAPPTCGGTRESLRWRLVQRYYFNSTFGKNVLALNRRNVLETTLDLSGVAFLTDPRAISPLISELRLSATSHLDLEWDLNYDTHAGKFTQDNIFLNFHQASYFGGASYARLNAPGRFFDSTTNTTSQTSDFSQLRLLAGYGTPTRPGFSIAANLGLDLKTTQTQYATLQTGYNWKCCGISGEYRKFELGSVRNENAYRFNFTLANIGSAGNLRRAERLF